MAKGSIIIDESRCLGCGYCKEFCPQGCIEISADRFSPLGYLVPAFSKPDECTGCAFCAWMCPHLAIRVFKMTHA